MLNLPSNLLYHPTRYKLNSNDWVISFFCVSCLVGQLPLPAWMLAQSPWIARSFSFVFCATEKTKKQTNIKQTNIRLKNKKTKKQWNSLKKGTRRLATPSNRIFKVLLRRNLSKQKQKSQRGENCVYLIKNNSLNEQIKHNKLKKYPHTFYWAHYALEERKRTDQVCPSSSRRHQHSVSGKKKSFITQAVWYNNSTCSRKWKQQQQTSKKRPRKNKNSIKHRHNDGVLNTRPPNLSSKNHWNEWSILMRGLWVPKRERERGKQSTWRKTTGIGCDRLKLGPHHDWWRPRSKGRSLRFSTGARFSKVPKSHSLNSDPLIL